MVDLTEKAQRSVVDRTEHDNLQQNLPLTPAALYQGVVIPGTVPRGSRNRQLVQVDFIVVHFHIASILCVCVLCPSDGLYISGQKMPLFPVFPCSSLLVSDLVPRLIARMRHRLRLLLLHSLSV
uniref:(northern house mosquito) hypothetical protein n=1 Tax=Culex pipiens TaxID=7175 RepID=A0A8D8C0J1_CULPI